MKKYLSLLFITLFILLALAACNPEDTLTYDHEGTIIITVKNDDINASDVTVITSDDNSDVTDRSGKKITISVTQLIRDVFTLQVEGYISQNIVVQSLDYKDDFTHEVDVTFVENYISAEITVETDCDSEDIELECDDIITMTRTRNVFDLTLKRTGIPVIEITAGTGYRSETITLTDTEIDKGICSRTVLLIPLTFTLVELEIKNGGSAYIWAENMSSEIQTYNKGNRYFFGVPKGHDYSIDIQNSDYTLYGRIPLTAAQVNASDKLVFSTDDAFFDVQLQVQPIDYNMVEFPWFVFAEKTSESVYVPVLYNSYSYDRNVQVSQTKTYTVFAMGNDGKIRYKDFDVSDLVTDEYGYKNITVAFNTSDPVKEVTVEINEFTGTIDDFTGLEIGTYSNNSGSVSQGTITSGNTKVIVTNKFYTIIETPNLNTLFPDLRVVSNSYASYGDDEFMYNLAINGVFEVTLTYPIDLYIQIDSENSYEGKYFQADYGWGTQYFIDENNTAVITDFNLFSSQGFYHTDISGQKEQFDFEFDDIYKDEITGDYCYTIVIDD